MKKILVSICALFLLTGCGDKVALTSTEFNNKMTEKGYNVVNVKEQFEYDYITDALVAVSSDKKYQIEFYVLSTDDYAASFYGNNKTIFENSKTSNNTETSVNLGNHSKYTLTTNGKFKVVSRIKNTVIYLNVDEVYKNEVKDVLKSLGY